MGTAGIGRACQIAFEAAAGIEPAYRALQALA